MRHSQFFTNVKHTLDSIAILILSNPGLSLLKPLQPIIIDALDLIIDAIDSLINGDNRNTWSPF